jgi:hypothetical protein
MRHVMTRRAFAKLSTAAAGAAAAPALTIGNVVALSSVATDVSATSPGAQAPARTAENTNLQSELLFDMVLETQPAHTVGPDLVIVPVSGGVFEGPGLKGRVVGPGGDWIVQRHGSSVLDVRLVLQTDDAEKISMTWRGISHTPPGGAQYARILPLFETGAEKYAWLNHLVAVGVHQPMAGKVAYRVYRIL